MKKHLIALTLAAVPFMAHAGDVMQAKQNEARGIAKAFGGQLQPELGKAMKAGGPMMAIEVCFNKAPQIAKELSASSGWNVKRVSLKPRNAGAKPDAWEQAALKWFEEQAAAGQDPKTLEKFEVVQVAGQQTYRYMKPLPTTEVCLVCHGTNVAPALKEKILSRYPHDMATGYGLGQIRGAFSFTQVQ